MRLGIYGGTFDPVHYAHLLLAEQCREQLALDQVWFLPAAAPPHKSGVNISPAKDRLEMLRLATAGHGAFAVHDREIRRGGTSYTVDTLAELVEEDPRRELFLLMGADSFADLPTWREPERILQLATIAAVNRGRGAPDLGPVVARLGAAARNRIRVLEMPPVGISASDLRARVGAGKSIRYLIPRAAEQYITEHGLYRA